MPTPIFDAAAIQGVINTLAASSSDVKAGFAAMLQTVASIADPTDKLSKSLRGMSDSVSDIAESLDDSITKYKQINSITMRLRRLTAEELKDRAKLERTMTEAVEQMVKAKDALEDDAVAAGKVEAQIQAMRKALLKVHGPAADLTAELDKVRDAGVEAAKAVRDISFAKPISGAEALGDAFGKALGGLKILDSHGFKGLIGQLETTRNKVKALRDESKKDIKAGKERMLQEFGTTKLSDIGSKFRAAGTQAEKDSMIRTLSSKTGASGWMDRRLGSMAMRSAAAGGSGGGLMGRAAGGLMEMGGGSVMGGLGAVASRAALPVAVITGILQVLQKGFDRNKEVYSALGGGGIVGTGAQTGGGLRSAYTGWSNALTSRGSGFGSGTGTFYGMNFEKSLDAMKEVVESGIAVQGKEGGIHKGRNIDDVIGGGRATDIYSGVMRNAAVFGKPIGMDSTEAARESMKMMKEFSLSMGEVEDLFISIHQAVQTTGISTSKYLELINGITSQFDKFNKSLNFTVALVAALGKGAKYTAEDLQGMVKGLMGEKKDLVQSAFAYQSMGSGGREGLVRGYEQQSGMTREELRKQKGFENIDEKTTPEEILRRAQANGDQATMTLAQRYNQEQTKAGASRRLLGRGEQEQALGFAALDSNTGSDPKSSIVKQLSLLNVAMKNSGGSLLDFRQSDRGQVGRVQDALSNPILTKLSEMLGLNISDTQKYMTQTMSQMASEVELAGKAGGGKESDEAAARLGLSEDERGNLAKELRGGAKANETSVFKDVFNESGMARMANTITEEARKTSIAAAEKNQRFLTGPLDYIQKALAALVENIVRMLNTLVNWATFTIGKSDAEKRGEYAADAKRTDDDGRTTQSLQMGQGVMAGTQGSALAEVALEAHQFANKNNGPEDPANFVGEESRGKLRSAIEDVLKFEKQVSDARQRAKDRGKSQAEQDAAAKESADLGLKKDFGSLSSSQLNDAVREARKGVFEDYAKNKTSMKDVNKNVTEKLSAVNKQVGERQDSESVKKREEAKAADPNVATAAAEAAKTAALNTTAQTGSATVEVVADAPGPTTVGGGISAGGTGGGAAPNISNTFYGLGFSQVTYSSRSPGNSDEKAKNNLPGYSTFVGS